jgi:hypothetical protein
VYEKKPIEHGPDALYEKEKDNKEKVNLSR